MSRSAPASVAVAGLAELDLGRGPPAVGGSAGSELRVLHRDTPCCHVVLPLHEREKVGFIEREKVGFIENTAMRHRWGGGREVTVTSRLHRQKDTERQRKTEENVERRPVVTPRYESGGEAQALVRPARDRGLPWPKTCAARVVA